jgi:ribosome-binding factor A
MRQKHHRTERVAEEIRHTVATFLTGEIRDPRIGFVTVTGVRVSGDLGHAWVSVSVIGVPEEQERSLEGLNSAAGYLRVQLAKELKLRVVPELHFELDKGLEHSTKIERLLKDLKDGQD